MTGTGTQVKYRVNNKTRKPERTNEQDVSEAGEARKSYDSSLPSISESKREIIKDIMDIGKLPISKTHSKDNRESGNQNIEQGTKVKDPTGPITMDNIKDNLKSHPVKRQKSVNIFPSEDSSRYGNFPRVSPANSMPY